MLHDGEGERKAARTEKKEQLTDKMPLFLSLFADVPSLLSKEDKEKRVMCNFVLDFLFRFSLLLRWFSDFTYVPFSFSSSAESYCLSFASFLPSLLAQLEIVLRS